MGSNAARLRQPRTKLKDRELPDYTLHPDAVESVQFLQKHNIKTSGYFNPICVNYNSRKFKADKLNSFVLTRINTVDNYNAGKAGDISICRNS